MEIKNAVKFNKNIWDKVGQKAIDLIKGDLEQGKFQNGRSGAQYSREYAKYKANSMRRLSRTKVKTFDGINYLGRVKGKVKSQTIQGRFNQTTGTEKLKAYYGKSTNTHTAFVNLELTGDMLKAMHVSETDDISVIIRFNKGADGDKQVVKIIGNRDRGYDIVGLSKENQKKVTEYAQELIRRKIKGEGKTTTVIEKGKVR